MIPIAPKSGLALFFTLGVSLEYWQQAGYLQREANYYQRLGEAVGPITWITYGGEADQEIAASLDGIRVLSNIEKLSSQQFAEQIGQRYTQELADIAIFKSNQIKGAQAAIRAAHTFPGKAVIRCGYLLSRFRANENPTLRMKFGLWRQERALFKQAAHVFLPTREDVNYAQRWYRLKHTSVLPNFVDTEQFKPRAGGERTKGLIGFVGRLVPQKNLPTLLKAAASVEGARLRIIGEGEQEAQLRALAQSLSLPVEFTGNVAHEEIPTLLADCQCFVLPSLYEGMPKALIEAMALGLPVIATAVDGSDALIRHKETGWLAQDPSIESLAEGLRALLNDSELSATVGAAARELVVRQFSKEAVLDKEIQVYRRLLHE